MVHRPARALPFAWRARVGVVVTAVVVLATGCAIAGASHSSIAPPPQQLGAESVVFPSGSGSLIHAWLSRGRVGAGAVLLLHGVGANRAAMLGRAQFLHNDGFTVLAPDFQAHGESPGEHVTFGARESLDAAAAMAYLREIMPAERVGVIGVSMGGAATLLGPGPISANAFVLESVYPTIRQAVSDRLATWFGPFSGIGRWFTSPVIGIVGSEIGVSENDLQPISRIGSIGAPLLLISGTDDRYTPLAEAESLYAHAPARKSFWAVVGAGHEDLHDYVRSEYERRVGGFLARCLRASVVGQPNDPC
ncbi:MAG TPA: alpha/beta fold hydrolase [Gemmatimonadaceae bacterium]|nr:alpha/beta fold hydrolase [Gemmatimonadaceae bacterium]